MRKSSSGDRYRSKFQAVARGVMVEFGKSSSRDYYSASEQADSPHILEKDIQEPKADEQGRGSAAVADPYGVISRWKMRHGNGLREAP